MNYRLRGEGTVDPGGKEEGRQQTPKSQQTPKPRQIGLPRARNLEGDQPTPREMASAGDKPEPPAATDRALPSSLLDQGASKGGYPVPDGNSLVAT